MKFLANIDFHLSYLYEHLLTIKLYLAIFGSGMYPKCDALKFGLQIGIVGRGWMSLMTRAA